jgi:hypothetical protein
VLLGSGAVALVAAGAGSLAGASAGQLLLTLLVVTAAGASVYCGRRRLTTSEETLAAAAVVLAAVGALETARTSPGRPVVLLAVLAGAFALTGRLAPTTSTWPLASWASAQLAVVTALAGLPLTTLGETAALLGTTLAGVGLALVARRGVARTALVTTLLWWAAGVVQASRLIWADPDPATATAAAAAALVVVAAAGLLALRRRGALRDLLGPRPAVPVLAGLAAGEAVAGALQTAGPDGVPAAGYLGLSIATLVALSASPRPNSVLRPAGLTTATTLTALAVVRLLAEGRWSALAVLLAVAAAPAFLVAARQPADRPGALPVALGCLSGSVLLAEADGSIAHAVAGPLLLLLAVAALGAAAWLRRHRSERPLAVSGVLVGIVALVHVAVVAGAPSAAAGSMGTVDLEPPSPPVALAVLGVALVWYGTRADRSAARAGGCASLVLAAWVLAADAEAALPEAYTLPAAAVLLLYPGRRLATDPSWPTWGPALVTGFAPSVWFAVTEPGLGRLLLVVAAATVATAAGAARSVQAPLLVGAVALVTAAVGRLAQALPGGGQLALIAAGAVLVAVGVRYESRRRPLAGVVAHVADMR